MNKQVATIAVIDDDKDVLIAAQLLLKRHFTEVLCFSDPVVIEELIETKKIDVFLLDMNFALGTNTGEEGLHWLTRILELSVDAVVVLMTAYGDINTSIKAMKLGATDFVLKPWQNEKLLATLNSALMLSQSRNQVGILKQEYREATKTEAPVAESSKMKSVFQLAKRSAATDVNVLILGENGVGKEVLAKQVHANSARSKEILVSVDLGAVPETLFESELFGHVKGAFTGAHIARAGRFQAASGGTLFLDEIGNLPLHSQAKLLRVLENREVTPVGSDKSVAVDVRLICATNMPLQTLVEEGKFRADLFYRINTVQIAIPPLRERTEDIPNLVVYFLNQYRKKHNMNPKELSNTAMDKLMSYAWPGNVRELAHSIERSVILSDSSVLQESDFFLESPNQRNIEHQNKGAHAINFNLEDVERSTIEAALRSHGGNISHAAEALGITRTSLYRRLKKHGL